MIKNLQIFRLCQPMNLSTNDLAEELAIKTFKPCHKVAHFSFGWVSPLGENSDQLVHECNGYRLMHACREDKILPPQVIREAHHEKIKKFAAAENRILSAKEKKSLRDEVIFDLLPQAFTKKNITPFYFDHHLNCLLVDSSSHSVAEEITVLIRDCVGRFDLRPPETKHNPSSKMTEWVLEQSVPKAFELAENCTMIDPKGLGSIRCSKQDLYHQDIRNHLRSGKKITSLGLTWDEKIAFTLNEDMSLRNIRFLDIIKDQINDIHVESQVEQIDRDFAIMSAELTQLIELLQRELGGWQEMSNVDAISKAALAEAV